MNKIPLSSTDRVLVLAVHPDDESLSAGGLIQHAVARRAGVHVVFLTDGDNNPWPQRYVERRWHIDSAARNRWGKRRNGEAVAALSHLGVPSDDISFWHYPDQGITALLLSGGGELIEKLSVEINRWRPTVIVAPSRHDLHPDHSALAVLLHLTLARDRLDEISPFHLLKYLVHSRGEEHLGEFAEVVLTSEQITRKRKAILSHETQMALSRGRFLAFAQPTEIFTMSKPSTGGDDDCPRLVSAKWVGDVLQLNFPRSAPSAKVFIVAETVEGAVRLSFDLSSRSFVELNDTITGNFKGEARLVRGRGQDTVFLPSELFRSTENIFIKTVFARGFFDRTGWFWVHLASLQPAVTADEPTRKGEPRVCTVIPCYNVAGVCGPVVRAAAALSAHVIAVNDGSRDGTESVLRDVAANCGNVEVLSRAKNGGKGIALLEAFRHACDEVEFDVMVTLDGDGQHRPEDIPRLIRAVREGNHALVIGERQAREKMPLRSRFGNTLTAELMKLLHPGTPTDTQSGYRAFRRDFVREIVGKIRGGRYETELEILLLALRQGRSIGSVGIPTVYLDGNRLSHFRPILDSWRIYRTLFRWQLKGGRISYESQSVSPHANSADAQGFRNSE
ncbi:MAG: PIG-L family deacetylase [Lacunisphaera sp.]